MKFYPRILLGIFLMFSFSLTSNSQGSSGDEEFVLNFSHPTIGNFYVSAIYSNNQIYLPLSELFNIFYINVGTGSSSHHLQGQWLTPGSEWSFNVVELSAKVNKKEFAFSVDEFRLGEMDVYLSPALFEKIFGLKFEVNMKVLNLKVTYSGVLPIEDRKKREALRKKLQTREQSEKDYPLLFPRHTKFIGLGFVDYYLEGNFLGGGSFSSIYNLHSGIEFLGGDLEGSFSGSLAPELSSVFTSNVRWRHAFKENKFLNNIYVGQLSTTSTEQEMLVGVGINNEPIRPRQVFHTYQIDGTTVPDSEVELYVNDQLVDFTRANELGYYRFNFPLTYGTVRMSTRIYTPTGQVIFKDDRMQIPFNFLPKGNVTYNLQAGIPDSGTGFEFQDDYIMHGDIGVGISPAITARLGVDYSKNLMTPTVYGSLTTRMWNNFLFNVDVAPQKYLKAVANYIMYYGNSVDLSYTKYDTKNYESPGLVRQEVKLGMFFPITIKGWASGIRFSATNRDTEKSNSNLMQVDYNTNIGKVNFRLNYMNQLFQLGSAWYSANQTASTSMTYTIARSPGVPVFAKGMFVRGQYSYDLMLKQSQEVSLQFSRSYKNAARINLMASYDLRFDKLKAMIGVQLDFPGIRSGTQFDYDGSQYSVKQSLSGSAGLDVNTQNVRFSNRDNVGRAAASVMMFMDENENRKFDLGEKIVPAKAIRMKQFTSNELGHDGIMRLTQLQSYWTYQIEVSIASLPDPTLAPLFTQFSFVADPNQYKRIEIPMYRAGIMEGNVILVRDGEEIPLSGVRVILKSKNREFEEIIKTFSDGGFYSLSLIPGKYTMEIDPVQLDFLQAFSDPPVTEFEVKASSEGDYIGGIVIRVQELAMQPVKGVSP